MMLSRQARNIPRCLHRHALDRNAASLARFSTTWRQHGYEETIHNLKIGAHTKVMFQGFTGKQATANAKESMDWGTNVVGGAKPQCVGEHLGKPVFPSVRAAMEQLKPDATGVYVAAHQAAPAIEEAIEAEVPLIVAVAEHIPLHDMMRIHSMLSSQCKSRLVGANAPGIISARGRCRIGFQPLTAFSPGHIGVVAKSGTLSYEAVGSLTAAGLGQSLCIGVGGDVMAGTSFIDALKVFEEDDDTEAIVMVGELGGTAEEEAAEWIMDYHGRSRNPKPIAAVIGGFQAAPGRIMGHAGAWTGLGEGTSASKYKSLEKAGVTMVDHPAKFGGVMKGLLKSLDRPVKSSQGIDSTQHRLYHTFRARPRKRVTPYSSRSLQVKRSLHLNAEQAAPLLKEYGINLNSSTRSAASTHFVGISPSRSTRSPSIIAAPTTDPKHIHQRVKRFPFDYRAGPSTETIIHAIAHCQLDAAPPRTKAQATKLIKNTWNLYRDKEAIDISFSVSVAEKEDSLHISNPHLFFDDAAFRSNKRQSELHALGDNSHKSKTDREAEKAGIVYIALSPSCSPPSYQSNQDFLVGTIVNGAGLAMNTNDTLHARLFPHTTSANFLDTGGKATCATIKTSFELVLSDPRVAVVFVNIFGGLTLCDMIAEGIILAFKEVGVSKPCVVRLRGTNEEAGRRVLREARLKVFAYEDFEEAVRKVGELVEGAKRRG